MGPTFSLLFVVFLLFPTFSRKCSTIPTFSVLNIIYTIKIQNFLLAHFAGSDFRNKLLYLFYREQTAKTANDFVLGKALLSLLFFHSFSLLFSNFSSLLSCWRVFDILITDSFYELCSWKTLLSLLFTSKITTFSLMVFQNFYPFFFLSFLWKALESLSICSLVLVQPKKTRWNKNFAPQRQNYAQKKRCRIRLCLLLVNSTLLASSTTMVNQNLNSWGVLERPKNQTHLSESS